jgi:hypothetical protein
MEEEDKKSSPRMKRKNQEKRERMRYFLAETSTSLKSQYHTPAPSKLANNHNSKAHSFFFAPKGIEELPPGQQRIPRLFYHMYPLE